MIDISVEKTRSDYRISAKGHAHSGQFGQDLVCCAVSTVMQGIELNYPEHSKRKDGINICVHEPSDTDCAVLDAFVLVLEYLSLDYPEYVSIKKSSEGEKN